MDEVLNGENIIFAEVRLDDTVVGEGNALLVDLSVSTLVDQLTNGLEVRLAVCDVRLDETEHLLSCLCDLDEDTVVDLEETEQLQNFTGFGCDLVDTLGTQLAITHNKEYRRPATHPRIRITKYTLG